MYRSVYDLRAFYAGKIGRIVRRVLKSRIREFWPDVSNLRVMGCGYASPYLRAFKDEADRVFAIMPAGQGAHHWPTNSIKHEYNVTAPEKNLVCLAEETELPIETSSIDRALLIHDLEFSEHLKENLAEIWRVLKPGGRILVVVPNRSGFWARADWSPMGQGAPYSLSQIQGYLRDNMFVPERSCGALFMPPVKFAPVLRSAELFERMGRKFLPIPPGVHMVEATKQIYGRIDTAKGKRVMVRGRAFVPRPAPQGVG
jgi:SAM-dependent methyltransferase